MEEGVHQDRRLREVIILIILPLHLQGNLSDLAPPEARLLMITFLLAFQMAQSREDRSQRMPYRQPDLLALQCRNRFLLNLPGKNTNVIVHRISILKVPTLSVMVPVLRLIHPPLRDYRRKSRVRKSLNRLLVARIRLNLMRDDGKV
jgi:hypothetical protein